MALALEANLYEFIDISSLSEFCQGLKLHGPTRSQEASYIEPA